MQKVEVKFHVWPKSRGNDQDTFGTLFTLCTMDSTVHSRPHNVKRKLHPLHTMHCVIRPKTGVPSTYISVILSSQNPTTNSM